jgi:hypothetical protein
VSDREALQRRIRRNALLLAALALVVYVLYFLVQISSRAT